MQLAVVILAAGRGTRFRSAVPKILHTLGGRSLIAHAVQHAVQLKPQRCVIVVNPSCDAAIQQSLAGSRLRLEFARQDKPLGTAHAVQAAQKILKKFPGHVLILAGDVPLMCSDTLRHFVRATIKAGGPGAVLSVEQPDPRGYGRIVRSSDETVRAIVEERDADGETRAIREVNTGVFCCRARWLFDALARIGQGNAQGEFYLTDIAALAAAEGDGLHVVRASDPEEFLGVNSRGELARAEICLRRRLVDYWMDHGVTFRDPESVTIGTDVRIGEDCIIGPHVSLHGATTIGAQCHIEQGAIISDALLATHIHVRPYSIIEHARVGAHCIVGPFARLRPETVLAESVHVGNFVELKKTQMKTGAKANHLTYLGDATVGARTNIGCGTITCNYDGAKKQRTTIGDDVFVGSDVAFVAPVTVGRKSTIAAGSVVTENIPPHTLAIARSRQVNKRGWKRK